MLSISNTAVAKGYQLLWISDSSELLRDFSVLFYYYFEFESNEKSKQSVKSVQVQYLFSKRRDHRTQSRRKNADRPLRRPKRPLLSFRSVQ